MKRMSCLSQKARTPSINPGGGTTYPPSPWIGSIISAAVSSADVSCAGATASTATKARGFGGGGGATSGMPSMKRQNLQVEHPAHNRYLLNRERRGSTSTPPFWGFVQGTTGLECAGKNVRKGSVAEAITYRIPCKRVQQQVLLCSFLALHTSKATPRHNIKRPSHMQKTIPSPPRARARSPSSKKEKKHWRSIQR